MNEGWSGDYYLILLDEAEITSASDRYGMAQLLPGYEVQACVAGMISLSGTLREKPIPCPLFQQTRGISRRFLFQQSDQTSALMRAYEAP